MDATHDAVPAAAGAGALARTSAGPGTQDGFFIRPRVFGEDELARPARGGRAGRGARAGRRPDLRESYQIDGNRYCEAAGATIQFEHRPGSETIRVIEPFHHLEPVLRGR